VQFLPEQPLGSRISSFAACSCQNSLLLYLPLGSRFSAILARTASCCIIRISMTMRHLAGTASWNLISLFAPTSYQNSLLLNLPLGSRFSAIPAGTASCCISLLDPVLVGQCATLPEQPLRSRISSFAPPSCQNSLLLDLPLGSRFSATLARTASCLTCHLIPF
jgi:hypothetical protein